MCFACWIPKATETHTHTHTHYHNAEYSLLFHGNNGYANGPQFYVTLTHSCLVLSTTREVLVE